jgi:deoxyribose-phosphate aldolase
MNLVKSDIQQLIQQAETATTTVNAAQLISLLDLTSLNADDTVDSTQQLCQKAVTAYGNVAAICIYPQFLTTASEALRNNKVKLATVVNFPDGNDHLHPALKTIEQAINHGANEIDLVMPYHAFLAGDTAMVEKFVLACKEMCGANIILKVILETGALQESHLIYTASRLAIENGADFLKTSTGKIAINATLEAAAYMLLAIKDSGKQVGFKASGGIRTPEQAMQYVNLAELIMGKDWAQPSTLRLGASSLIDALVV